MRRFVLFVMVVATSTLLAACGAGGTAGLTGKDWQLTSITEKVPAFHGVLAAAEQSKYTITFASDLTFRGTADCEQIAGTYKTSGSNGLTIQRRRVHHGVLPGRLDGRPLRPRPDPGEDVGDR